jgi:tRNA-uridine 2-sulfurtransferase
MVKKKTKALFLFSGGLDSLLGVRLLEQQNIKVDLIFLESYFFKSDLARQVAQANGLKLKVIDFSSEQLAVVKSPRHGYGRGFNPCVDCHALMLKLARQKMDQDGYDFVATGEVLGQRPMSQTKERLKLVEKESGLQGFLLRPLSAQLLQITIPEMQGLIDRQKLESISGRSRRKQLALAAKFGLTDYPSPAGGCLLTDKEFSLRLKELLKKRKNISGNDIELSKLGRHYWSGRVKIVVGRDENENKLIKKLAQAGDWLVGLKKVAGPTTLIRSYAPAKTVSTKVKERAQDLTRYHAPRVRNKEVEFQLKKV